jgi:TPR repeat protein
VAQSDVKVARWYRKAADQGLAQAQYNLGVMFDQGCGVAQSDMEAVRWLRKAADQGDAQAQYNLGVMFDQGRGVAQSDAKSGFVRQLTKGTRRHSTTWGTCFTRAAVWRRATPRRCGGFARQLTKGTHRRSVTWIASRGVNPHKSNPRAARNA